MSTKNFHLGHAFSQAMPEIKSVKGRPLADLIESQQPLILSDNQVADALEIAFEALVEADIELGHPYSSDKALKQLYGGRDISRKEYLVESFANFLIAEDLDQ